jgi:hypothetical protein
MRWTSTVLGLAAACGGGGGGGDDGGDDAPAVDANLLVDGGPCVGATLLWSEDWETGDYSRWTSMTYGNDWGDACQSNAISTTESNSPTRSNRSEIVCEYVGTGGVHRGYGGLQFDGDAVVPAYTNTGQGIDAPGGLVNTFWARLESPTVFENGTWFSYWTVNGSCDWSEQVLTLGLEDPSDRLAAAHYQPGGGTRTFEPGAPGIPRGQWSRITIYVNYHDEIMHVWQDGVSISHVTFVRDSTRICQWHWGAYASADNSDVVLYEDDNAIWKLDAPWTDFAVEPWLASTQPVCP